MNWIDAEKKDPDHSNTVLVDCGEIKGEKRYHLAHYDAEIFSWWDDSTGDEVPNVVLAWTEITPREAPQ